MSPAAQMALRKPLKAHFDHFWALLPKALQDGFWSFILSISGLPPAILALGRGFWFGVRGFWFRLQGSGIGVRGCGPELRDFGSGLRGVGAALRDFCAVAGFPFKNTVGVRCFETGLRGFAVGLRSLETGLRSSGAGVRQTTFSFANLPSRKASKPSFKTPKPNRIFDPAAWPGPGSTHAGI